MSDFVRNLAQRAVGLTPIVQPSLTPAFPPPLSFDAPPDFVPHYDLPIRPPADWKRQQAMESQGTTAENADEQVKKRIETIQAIPIDSSQPPTSIAPTDSPSEKPLTPTPPVPAALSAEIPITQPQASNLEQQNKDKDRAERKVFEETIIRKKKGLPAPISPTQIKPTARPQAVPTAAISVDALPSRILEPQPNVNALPSSNPPIQEVAGIVEHQLKRTTNQPTIVQPAPISPPSLPQPAALIDPLQPPAATPPVEIKIGAIEIKGTPLQPSPSSPTRRHPQGFADYAKWRGGN